jgi:hypothetical protein
MALADRLGITETLTLLVPVVGPPTGLGEPAHTAPVADFTAGPRARRAGQFPGGSRLRGQGTLVVRYGEL